MSYVQTTPIENPFPRAVDLIKADGLAGPTPRTYFCDYCGAIKPGRDCGCLPSGWITTTEAGRAHLCPSCARFAKVTISYPLFEALLAIAERASSFLAELPEEVDLGPALSNLADLKGWVDQIEGGLAEPAENPVEQARRLRG